MHQQSLNLSRRIIKLSKCIFRSQMLLKYVIPVPNYHIHYVILRGVLMWRPPPPHNNTSPPPPLPSFFFLFSLSFSRILLFCSSSGKLKGDGDLGENSRVLAGDKVDGSKRGESLRAHG